MADASSLNMLIADAVSDTLDDLEAAEDLQACLIAGLGLVIATTAAGDPRATSAMCQRAAALIVEQAASMTAMFAVEGRA